MTRELAPLAVLRLTPETVRAQGLDLKEEQDELGTFLRCRLVHDGVEFGLEADQQRGHGEISAYADEALEPLAVLPLLLERLGLGDADVLHYWDGSAWRIGANRLPSRSTAG